MNKTQAAKAIKVIEKDATGTNTMYDPGRETMCVLGGLLHAAGVPKHELMIGYPLGSQRRILESVYGITDNLQGTLIDTNDRYKTIHNRRKGLIKLVESWVEK